MKHCPNCNSQKVDYVTMLCGMTTQKYVCGAEYQGGNLVESSKACGIIKQLQAELADMRELLECRHNHD